MDRRKIVSRNPLHKKLYSSSQTAKKSVVVGGLDIVRSVSATNESLGATRKRKNSEDQQDDDDNMSNMSSPKSSLNAKKKKKRNLSDDDSNEEEAASPPKRPSPNNRGKETSSDRKSDNSEKEEENDSSKSNGGSYIRGILEALDKSPAKLSQSSTSSLEKYRKMNLRTPLRAKVQRPTSKAIADKKGKEAKESEKPVREPRDPRIKKTDLKKILPGPASSKKKTPQKDVSDEEMVSDSDFAPVKKSSNVKKNLAGPASSKKKTPQKDISDDDDTDFAPAQKATNSKKNLSGSASSKKKASQKDISDDEEMMSDTDVVPSKKITNVKRNLAGPASSKKKTPQKDVSDEEMLSDSDFAPVKKSSNVKKNLAGPASSKKKTLQKDISDDDDTDFAPAQKATNSKKNLSGSASSKKKASQKDISDDEEMASDTDFAPAKKVTNSKKNLSGSASLKKKMQEKTISDDEEIMSDTDVVPPNRLVNKTKNKSPERTPAKSSKEERNKTPVRSQRKRIVDSPELSPLKTFQSPERERTNVTQRKKRNINQTDNRFLDFVNAAEITLCSGDNLHIASENPVNVVHKMKDLLATHSVDEDELIESWKSYIEDEDNLQKSLLEMRIETDEGVAVCSKAVSLSRLLLQVPHLQIEILKNLFRKLVDAVITTESSDDAPWALQMLQQFRFLETVVAPDALVDLIEELLSSSPEWFQREVIVFIPDIVTDAQHRTTAEMLVKIMENNSDLTNIILDCVHNLILSKEYREELRDKVLGLLDKKFDKSNIPPITRFVLYSCSTEAIAFKCLNALRKIDMAPTSKDKADECYTHQSFMVNAIKMSIQLFKEVTQAAVAIVKSDESKPGPLDIILSILLYEATAAKKKIIEATLPSHIKTGHYKTDLLGSFYNGYKSVAKSFQSSALNLAIGLLKADNEAHIEFGIEWVRYMFASQADTSYRQREIMEKLLNLMGAKDKTVKNALEVLIRMSNDDNERRYLQQHVGFLRSFLEKIDNLHFDDVASLYHLLHGLCTHSQSIADFLNDDLSIIMQKQLCSSKVQTKCKGVLGAAMAIKHLACEMNTKDAAYNLLRKTMINLKDCKRSETLFFDQLAQAIAITDDINKEFLTTIRKELEDHFEANCIVESSPDNLEPRFGLNDPTESDNINIYFGNCKFGAYVTAFFKLLRVCNFRDEGDLGNINAMLGSSILMPADLETPEPSTADYIIHCINWFRELIGAFVVQEEVLLRQQVLKRLESLMSLQGELVKMVAMLEKNYQPPPCYFNHFPTPQFVRLDLKMGKKGAKGKKKEKKDKDTSTQLDSSLSKSIILPEWEQWEKGSELTVKNPAFFRKMDTNIIHLLDINMDTHATQSSHGSITIAQVCFIVRELLNMFQNGVSESFVEDVIVLLPKVCNKLQQIVADLRQDDSVHEKEAVRLILCLFICIFNWKELTNSKHRNLLRDGLRPLAAMMSKSSSSLRSCKDLVVEAYKYFESLSDIATQITLAVALVKLCETLMKHSDSFRVQSKDRQAKMAHGFLCLEWNESHGPEYKAAVRELLKIWIENEPDPLQTVSSVLEWLPAEVAALERPQSRLSRMPSVTKINFHLFLKQIFVGLIKGIRTSLGAAQSDPERIKVWSDAGKCLEQISEICKTNRYNVYLTCYLRYTTTLYQMLLSSGMSVLEMNAKFQSNDIIDIIKLYSKSNKFMRDIFCTARKDKNVALLKLIPFAKLKREKFIYRVKGMLAANNSIGSFWMGNLLNRDLDGEDIDADSSDETTATLHEGTSVDDQASEILESDSDEDVDIDGDGA